jgi:hypothetical protein
MAGQPGAVAASPLDTGQGDGPEPAQPARQAGVASRGGRELPDAGQPADEIERGGDMSIGVVPTPPVTAVRQVTGRASPTMVTAIPFSG